MIPHSPASSHRLIPFVLIDDNDSDRLILEDILVRSQVRYPIRAFARTEDAVTFLSNATDHTGDATGALAVACFVDVHMKGFDGFEFLEWVRNHAAFERMPITVVSGSDDPRHVERAAELGAQAYLLKFPGTATVERLMHAIEHFRSREESDALFAFSGNLFAGREPLPPVRKY